MGNRVWLSTVLILGAIDLMIAITIGNSVGNRVVRQILKKTTALPTAAPFASTAPLDRGALIVLNQHRNVSSIATDPAFPDPRVTPPPVAPSQIWWHDTSAVRSKIDRGDKRDHKAPPAPTAARSAAPNATQAPYTSPPLPMPIVSHPAGSRSDFNGEPIQEPAPSATTTTAVTASPLLLRSKSAALLPPN